MAILKDLSIQEEIYMLAYFTTIGGATPVSSGNMLAVCAPGGTCSNFVTDTNPYATGSDWGVGSLLLPYGIKPALLRFEH